MIIYNRQLAFYTTKDMACLKSFVMFFIYCHNPLQLSDSSIYFLSQECWVFRNDIGLRKVSRDRAICIYKEKLQVGRVTIGLIVYMVTFVTSCKTTYHYLSRFSSWYFRLDHKKSHAATVVWQNPFNWSSLNHVHTSDHGIVSIVQNYVFRAVWRQRAWPWSE